MKEIQKTRSRVVPSDCYACGKDVLVGERVWLIHSDEFGNTWKNTDFNAQDMHTRRYLVHLGCVDVASVLLLDMIEQWGAFKPYRVLSSADHYRLRSSITSREVRYAMQIKQDDMGLETENLNDEMLAITAFEFHSLLPVGFVERCVSEGKSTKFKRRSNLQGDLQGKRLSAGIVRNKSGTAIPPSYSTGDSMRKYEGLTCTCNPHVPPAPVTLNQRMYEAIQEMVSDINEKMNKEIIGAATADSCPEGSLWPEGTHVTTLDLWSPKVVQGNRGVE